jgi:hypothetical protein
MVLHNNMGWLQAAKQHTTSRLHVQQSLWIHETTLKRRVYDFLKNLDVRYIN